MIHATTVVHKLKPFIFVILLLPAVWLLYQMLIAPQLLGADPAKALVDQSGLWAIRSILLALAITPLRLLSGVSAVLIYRRMAGLFAFFYALVHFMIYSGLLLGFDVAQIATELSKRPYIIVGFMALLAYIPLAITSTHRWQKRLKRNWVKLHQLVYVIGILAVIHFTWLKKVGILDTWIYVLILVILFSIRIISTVRKIYHVKKK